MTASPLDQTALDSALRDSAWAGDLDGAEALIARGANVNSADETRQSAFLIAASEGFTELLQLALENGADISQHDSYDGTALIRAAERGHADIVGLLLLAGVPIDHVNNIGWTALHEALLFAPRAGEPRRGTEADYVDTARLLVAAGADVERPAVHDGATPAGIAAAAGLLQQRALLERALTEPKPHDASSVLLRAAHENDVDAATLALRHGADIETTDRSAATPLLRASAADSLDVARLLVRLGADPDAVDERSDTPWLVTGVTGSVQMAEILLRASPDFTLTNRFGGLSPIPAAERGHADYIERIVAVGIDLDHVNDLGWTALLEAVVLGDGSADYQRIVRTLVDAGVDIGIADRGGRTALDHAVARGQNQVAEILRSADMR